MSLLLVMKDPGLDLEDWLESVHEEEHGEFGETWRANTFERLTMSVVARRSFAEFRPMMSALS